jgi:hypothetical protein
MAKLTDEQKSYLVMRFACFASPSEVIEELKNRWNVLATTEQVVYYNASVLSGVKLADKWKALFEKFRAAYIADAQNVAIAHSAYRLHRMQKLLDSKAVEKNVVLQLAILEQAAKEVGGSYTNKREHSGPGGAPIPVHQYTTEEVDELRKLDPVELVARYREQVSAG